LRTIFGFFFRISVLGFLRVELPRLAPRGHVEKWELPVMDSGELWEFVWGLPMWCCCNDLDYGIWRGLTCHMGGKLGIAFGYSRVDRVDRTGVVNGVF
jgi:hypothetical protein